MIRLFVLLFLLLPILHSTLCAKPNKTVAAIIYSEAGPTCSFEERVLVASAIYNRSIWKDRYAFYNLRTMEDVVKYPGAFESYGHTKNSNWLLTQNSNLSKLSKIPAYAESYRLSIPSYIQRVRNTAITHFVTKGHSTKGLVSEKYWKLVLVKHTKNLSFYKIKSR